MTPLLQVRNLTTRFRTERGMLTAVDNVSFDLAPGETLAVVGESGSGKSVTALSLLRLIPDPPGGIAAGEVIFEGRDLLKRREDEIRAVRGDRVAMIFQEPMTSLNPVYTIGAQIAEIIRQHERLGRRAALDKTVDMLRLVNIPNPERRVRDYPHQFSGGMRQRVMIAMALACNPKLLIADEPTTALDVTIQAQILELLAEMKSRLGMAVLLITHAMGVVAETAQRVVVMYAGKVVEEAPVGELFSRPRHPYTQGLIRSIPRLDRAGSKTRLETIAGTVPNLLDPAPGCRFAPRCEYTFERCLKDDPPLFAAGAQTSACWLCENGRRRSSG